MYCLSIFVSRAIYLDCVIYHVLKPTLCGSACSAGGNWCWTCWHVQRISADLDRMPHKYMYSTLTVPHCTTCCRLFRTVSGCHQDQGVWGVFLQVQETIQLCKSLRVRVRTFIDIIALMVSHEMSYGDTSVVWPGSGAATVGIPCDVPVSCI